ncbi:DUF2264 domain-containing protein [Streptomyces zhihengii]
MTSTLPSGRARVSPPPDHALSPVTGYTRTHWESMADTLLGALRPYASPHLAQYHLPGRTGHAGRWSDGLEGYARSFLLAAFRIAGARGTDRPGDTVVQDLVERYTAGLVAGTDPRHPEHWPPITDRGQPMVEAASVALALHETRPWIWDRLPDTVQQHTADWLGRFVGATTNDSNWRLFQVIAEEFLASVGAPHSRTEIEDGLARLEDWYRGDGWYTDGDGRKFDYYNAFALHLYPFLWARIAGPRADPALVATHRARMRAFLGHHQHFFGSDGAPVHQGRSLTYRYATAAPLWAGALSGASPLPPGRTRRLASGALKHFTDRGVPDERGLLNLGWYGPYLPVTQAYSGPASPYWASKAFLGLLLPADHPVWTAPEEPSPVDTADCLVTLPQPGWLLHSTAADGIVRLVNHGSDRFPPAPAAPEPSPHYSRIAYSSVTAPETAPAGGDIATDNHLTLSESPRVAPRGRIHPLYAEQGEAASAYTPAGGGDAARIATASVIHGPWEVRLHLVRATVDSTVREGGWAVADDNGAPEVLSGRGWAVIRRRDGLTSALTGLLGWDGLPAPVVARAERAEGHNAFGHHSATPVVSAPFPAGTRLLATLVVLTADPAVGGDVHALRSGARVHELGDGSVDVRFPDGTTRQVDLGRLRAAVGKA